MRKSIVSASSLQTKNIAQALAKTVLEVQSARGALVLALAGELGSGKTTFTQGFAKGLGIKEKILSPTFIIMKKFEIPNPKSEKNTKYPLRSRPLRLGDEASESEASKILNTRYFYHIDCYRLDAPQKELLRLGFKGIIQNPRNIVVIEWADRIKKILPKDILLIQFEHGDKNKRNIIIR